MPVEPWYLNKLVWLNILLVFSGVSTLVADTLTKTPVLTVPGILMLVAGSIGVVMRVWFTDTITPQMDKKLNDRNN